MNQPTTAAGRAYPDDGMAERIAGRLDSLGLIDPDERGDVADVIRRELSTNSGVSIAGPQDDLGAAWRAVEERLPDGAFIYDLTRYHYDTDCSTESLEDEWQVKAGRVLVEPRWESDLEHVALASGSTPTAALRALAERLGERESGS